jgi:long-chain acyl-CoA synthetase
LTEQVKNITPGALTIPALFDAAVSVRTGAALLKRRDGEALETLSYRETALAVDAFSARVRTLGCGKGERVALLAENSWEWVVGYLGLLRAGCVAVPLDTLMPLEDILNILSHSEARLLYCSQRFAEQLEELSPEQRRMTKVELLPGIETLLAEHRDNGGSVEIAPADLAVIIYTSGTTGNSKGVMLSHGNLASNVLACREVCRILASDNFLLLLPLHHTFSSTVNMLLAIGAGASTTLATSYRSRDIVSDIRVGGVTILVGVPQVFENIMDGIKRAVAGAGVLKRALFASLLTLSGTRRGSGGLLFRSFRERAGLGSLRLMVAGGAALPVPVNRFFEQLGFVLIQGYGLTESGPVLSVNAPDRNRLGSVGRPLPGVRFRIEQPNAVGIGEVWAQGPNVMQGYFQNDAATKEALHDGWLRTGDAGYLDRDGYLYLTGRLKNIIVTPAGKNVYPEEIEAKLSMESAIADVLVLGVKRKERGGEEICALLKLNDEYLEISEFDSSPEETAGEIIRRYNAKAKPHLQIREWKLLQGDFEKTSTRKIKRFQYQDCFSQDTK